MSTVLVTRYDIWDLNNGKVSAYPVAKPPGWDDISLYYAKALQKMGWLDPGPNPPGWLARVVHPVSPIKEE